MMVPRGGTATGIEAMEVRVGGGGVIGIATGATAGDGATTAMIGAEAITAAATTEMIAAIIVGDGVTEGTS